MPSPGSTIDDTVPGDEAVAHDPVMSPAEDAEPESPDLEGWEADTVAAEFAAAPSVDDGAVAPEPAPPPFEGFVEIYGRHEASECWILGGWIARAWLTIEDRSVAAVFERGRAEGEAKVAFYEREDLGERGIGFLLLLPTPMRRIGRFQRLEIQSENGAEDIIPASVVRELGEQGIVERAEMMLAACAASDQTDAMRALLSRRFVGEGYIDLYGYHSPSSGWFICGWISNDWITQAQGRLEAVAQFEGGSCTGPVVLNYYEREDLANMGLGAILHLATVENDHGRLLTLSLCAGDAVVIARPARIIEMQTDDVIAGNLAGLIAGSDPGAAREELRTLASRAAYDGQDTIGSLRDPVFIDFDETVNCAPDSLVLFGWMLAKPGTIKDIRLRSAQHVFPVDLNTGFFWIDRNDVVESVGREHGFDDPRCGFLARVPTPHPLADDAYLEIETFAGGIGSKKIPRPRLSGVAAMKRMLGAIDVQYTNVDSIYDHLVGPAIAALNTQRLAAKPRVHTLQLGAPVANARYSVIVPLYGRIDFMEIQMAHFATIGLSPAAEIIYVLDDPPKTRESQFMAASLFERFHIPFRLLCLSHNVGFAPANNFGVAAATGDFICFMNSDVFPTTADWLEKLSTHLDADPSLGVVGPVLLFEDNSVQHQGIAFKNIPQFGNWAFPTHKRKGFRVPQTEGVVKENAITGACMVMRRDQVETYGGFDEAYVIGDFEDTDLCFRLRRAGFGAAVDFGVSMYHLERKSQVGSANLWRTNLTVYNAWVHQRRWSQTIAQLGDTP